MIVGGSKKAVIAHIKELAESGELNAKAELTDPALTSEQSAELINKFYAFRTRRIAHFFRRTAAYAFVKFATRDTQKSLVFDADVNPGHRGAIITSNHFNPLDAIFAMQLAKKWHKKLYIVSQETNLALPRPLDFLTNNLDLIPLSKSPHHIAGRFTDELTKVIQRGDLVLIYPEEEMWFNYKKPRPGRPGAYRFGANLSAPIISCFTEMRDLTEVDNDEFWKIAHTFHVLGALEPDPKKSPRENAKILAEADYQLRCQAYEKIYGQKLNYKFNKSDIAGWRG